MPTPRRTNAERTRGTTRALLTAARRCFEAVGYAGTSLDQVADLAGVTKGALYHHFPNKQALYDAVVVDIQDEVYRRVDRRSDDAPDPLVAAFVAFLDAAPEPGVRLLLGEAPAVLGYRRWQEIDDERNLPGLLDLLREQEATGELALPATPELARVLATLANALGTLVSQDDDPDALRAAVTPIWEHLLRSLRPSG